MNNESFARVEAIARDLTRANQDLLVQRALQRRLDWKFLLTIDQMPRVLDRLAHAHAALWAGPEVLAAYETLYFDSADRRCFHDHRRGRPHRYKVRTRTYPDRHLTMLEVKRKQHGETVKDRMPRAFRDHVLDGEGRRFVSAHSPLHPDQLRPVLSNRFRRLTLLGLQAEQRVTFDLGLSFTQGDRHWTLSRLVVAEVKSGVTRSRTPALEAFSDLGLRPGRMSKYAVGTVLMNPGIRANRLLPVVRAVSRLEAS